MSKASREALRVAATVHATADLGPSATKREVKTVASCVAELVKRKR